MRNTQTCAGSIAAMRYYTLLVVAFIAIIFPQLINAQCVAVSGTVEGLVYSDLNSNGMKNPDEPGLGNVKVSAYNNDGTLLGFAITNASGQFSIGNLQDGKMVRLVFQHSSDYYPSYIGPNNGTTVQFVQVPVCSVGLGLLSDTYFCNAETQIVSTCFVQGEPDDNPDEPTIVGMKYGFDLSSPVTKYAMHGQTGSIWGITWKNKTKEIFSAAFVKQYAGLTEHGHDAIFVTNIAQLPPKTALFAKLGDLGQNVGTLSSLDIDECNFGAQVGKIGLGSLIISPDEAYLYTVNLFNNTLVQISTDQPSAATTKSWQIPNPQCSHGEYRAFALKYHKDKIYVGVTCTAETAKMENQSSANVYEFDPDKGTFSLIFTTNYIKGYWYDYPANGLAQMHWLTDIDFTDDGNMLLSLTDRLGHRYCRPETNRLDEQKPDLLMVWNDNGVWKLENNGKAGSLTGSGVGNGQGPGGGEFFGHEFWITNPLYHSEIALGSIFVMPGTNSVVAAVFDPDVNAYSGGFHRYSTQNGTKQGAIELYTRNTEIAFGKATGFGDIAALCGPPSIEIGNLVWIDSNDNGIQDADEKPVTGLTLKLLDKDCKLLSTTVTDHKGNYAFNASNVPGGIIPGQTYYVALDKSMMDPVTSQFIIEGEYYTIAKSKAGDTMLDNDGSMGSAACDMVVFAVKADRNNHNFDLGFASAGECQLLITSKLVNQKAVQIDDIISLEITISNNGTSILSDILIEGKMPNGFSWIADMNPAWTIQGNTLRFLLDGDFGIGDKESVLIHFKANKSAQFFDFTHTFEIAGVKDRNGMVYENFDFCFANPQSRRTSLTIPVFDLALYHKLDVEDYSVRGGQVKINTTVFNQGNVTAENFEIVNYLNDELDFNPLLNPGWEIDQDLSRIRYFEKNALLPGESRTFCIILAVKEDAESNQIVNYAEISASTGEGDIVNLDFDSYPDDDPKNDIGGEIGKSTDNMISDHGIVDEDDHDPVMILLESVDISLTKTTLSRRVKAGQHVSFNITIVNEGSLTIDNVKIIDYIPPKLILNDTRWNKVGNNAEIIVKFPDGFKPGQSHTESINFIVDQNATPALLINAAEVVEYSDMEGRLVSELDADSFADNIRGNDAFDPNNKGNREDDYDEAELVVGEIEVETRCLNNASNLVDGQCEVEIVIRGCTDDDWFIEQVVGLYTDLSPAPPASPIPFSTGYVLHRIEIEPGISEYVLNGRYVAAQGFSVRFRSAFGDLEDVEVKYGCSYTPVIITGPRSLCTGRSATYSIPAVPGVEYYVWTVNDVLTGSNSNTININWADYGPGTYQVKVVMEFEEGSTACYTPGLATVVIGAADLSAIACIGDFNVSLNGNCELVVTPAMMIAGSYNTSSPYIVLLMDKDGKLIPDARLTHEHLGTKVTAKLMEGCGGNSCWSTITVEDKIAPVSLCQSISLPCYKVDQYNGPFERDNCSYHVENKIISERITPVDCITGDPTIIKYIDRVYQATDASGNKSALCTMRISVERPDFSLLVWPSNKTMANNSVFVCDRFEKDENGMPSYKESGVPYFGNFPLYPSIIEACNLYAGYNDTDLGKIGCVRKIRRTWLVYEQWCSSGNYVYYDQMLEITDIIAPEIKPLQDITVSASFGACMARVNLPVATVTDECEGVLEVDITYPGGFFKNQNGGQIDLPVGVHTITYTAYDECRNSSSRSFKVTVEDKTPPVVICKGIVVAALNILGDAYVFPHHVNDGSYDACGIDSMRVARMKGMSDPADSDFQKFVSFGCEDAGKQIMVALKVWDTSGNSNTCMVTVEVQDKFPPQISCPPHTTIFCDDDFDVSNLSQFGTATAIDACGASVRELAPVVKLNACRVGTIERTFVATDNLGSASCKQIITVVRRNPFDPDVDVIKSIDFEVVNTCSKEELAPENFDDLRGYPVIREGICDLAAASYKDQVFTIVQGACYKIVRTWTIIDWCAMDADPEYQPYVFQQTIKVNKTIPPSFTSVNRDTTICTAPGNCVEGHVILRATGRDLCTPDNLLRWKYIIFLDNNPNTTITNSGLGAVININSMIKTGKHRIQWIFEDACGNLIVRDQHVNVTNCDGPKAVSLRNIAVGLVPWDINGDGTPDIEKACIYASSINASSFHPCNLPIRFSFSSDPNDTIRCYNCFDVGIVIDTFWVTDENGNQDWTTFEVDVQDNNDSDVCDNICIINAPDAQITGANQVCANDPVVLTASGGVSYIWSTGATTASITVNPAVSTTYVVTVTGEIGCTGTAEKTVNVLPKPVVTISGENICSGVSTTLVASGAVSYVWSTGATTNSITVSPPVTTTYTVTATGANGCTVVATRTVGVSTTPVVNIAGPSSTCPAVPVALTASGGATYLWSTGQTTATINVAPTATTTYTVTATDLSGCTASASRTVTVLPSPVVTITGNNAVCVGGSTTLTASGAASYLWSTGATTASITVNPASTTTYTVTATGTNGCTATATRTVTVNNLPDANITGTANICIGQSATLTASGGTAYVWSTGATTAQIVVSPNVSTTYTVTVTNQNTCTSTASFTVTVNPRPEIQISGNLSVCAGSSTTLTASGAATYLWSTGATTASITVSPQSTTTYTVTATAQNGCTATASRTVTVLPNANVSITGNNTLCVGASTTLTASGGNSYLWSTGATTASITVNPAVTTTYTVTATDANGCTGTASRTVTVNSLPDANITGTDAICVGQSSTLTATGGTSYVWSTGATTAQIVVTPSVTTTYTVTVTNQNTCTSTASFVVTVNPLPNVSIEGNNNICQGSSTTLTASGGNNYLWSTGATTPSITVNPNVNTTYTVTVTNANNCTATNSVTVTVRPLPTPAITGGGTICEGETITLTASGGVSYVWSTGATTPAITVAPITTTTYTVTVTAANGCTASTSTVVTVTEVQLVCQTQNATIYLNNIGQANLQPSDIIAAGSPICTQNINYTVNPNLFLCNDAASNNGVSIVTLTVTNTVTGQSINCTATVTVLDTIRPTLTCPPNMTVSCLNFNPNASLAVFGTATAQDNCPAGLVISELPIFNLNTCNVGTITRTFTATDVSGNSTQCVQLITVVATNPVTTVDIAFPGNITISNCDGPATPDLTGNVVVNTQDADCADISISFSDNVATGSIVCVPQIIRTWTVIDSCQLQPGTQNGIFTHQQIITVNLSTPVITGPLDTLIIVEYTGDCELAFNGNLFSATSCLDNLVFTNNSPYAFNNNSLDISGNYPQGIYDIVLTATDPCGRVDSFTYHLVFGFKRICFKGILVLTDNGTVTVDSDSVFINIPCGSGGILTASFSPTDLTDTLRTYDCSSLNINLGDTLYRAYLFYNGILFDSCAELFTITDPNGFCTGGRPGVRGAVVTANNVPVPDVEVELAGSGMPRYKTDNRGRYDFGEMDPGGTYDIVPSKDIHPLEGVSTLDLLLIQRHVLGLEKLKSPYNLIAADINNDGKISGADIVQLRKLLLGIVDRFPENTSWQMIDKSFVFPDPEDPFIFPYPESYHIEQLLSTMRVDFIGVKTGDVNGSYKGLKSDGDLESRSADAALLQIQDKQLSKGANEVEVFSGLDVSLNGLQVAIELPQVRKVQIVPAVLGIRDIHYHFENGYLFISYNADAEVRLQKGDLLFKLVLEARSASRMSESMEIASTIRSAEWYDHQFETRKLDIDWYYVPESTESFTVMGNVPNPWNNETRIQFYIPSEGNVVLKLRDVTGRILLERKQHFQKGNQQFTVLSNEISVPGLLYYELQFKDEVKTGKMLNIR